MQGNRTRVRNIYFYDYIIVDEKTSHSLEEENLQQQDLKCTP